MIYLQQGYWVFSKIGVNTESIGIHTFTDGRVVGVEITGPAADGFGGAIGGSDAGEAADGVTGGGKYYGVHVHDFGSDETSEFHHGTYVSNRDGYKNKAFEFGWNYFRNVKAIHGFHIYDQTPGGDWSGVIKIHHNVVVNQKGPAVNLMSGGTEITVPVEIYNNLFINCGLGPDAGAISPPKYAISLTEGVVRSHVRIYNNIIYAYGDEGSGAAVHQRFGGTVDLRNNIIVDTRNLEYVDFEPDAGSNNLFFSRGSSPKPPPAWATDPVTADPLFVDPEGLDFRLCNASPAIDAGTDMVSDTVSHDLFGTLRPQGERIDVGAHEYPSGSPPAM